MEWQTLYLEAYKYKENTVYVNGVTGGGGRQGGRVSPETSDWEIFADVSGKKGKGVKIEKKRRKIVKGKVENWKWK